MNDKIKALSLHLSETGVQGLAEEAREVPEMWEQVNIHEMEKAYGLLGIRSEKSCSKNKIPWGITKE